MDPMWADPLKNNVTALEHISILQDRGRFFLAVRNFLSEAGSTEVDCPLLSLRPSLDPYIECIRAQPQGSEERYLYSSPEYAMKRLLALGLGDCFQLSHVFRDGEYGPKHNPEFTMLEWYRVGWSLEALQEEVVAIIRMALGPLPVRALPYREALLHYAGVDYLLASREQLEAQLAHWGMDGPLVKEAPTTDDLLNLLLSQAVEPHLGQGEITLLTDYPASMAELSKVKLLEHGELVAARFEAYVQGCELANGYHELLDSQEQERRFLQRNQLRAQMGKRELPLDERFLSALSLGVPDCCGVALGLDRLLMLRHKKNHLAEVTPFSWPDA